MCCCGGGNGSGAGGSASEPVLSTSLDSQYAANGGAAAPPPPSADTVSLSVSGRSKRWLEIGLIVAFVAGLVFVVDGSQHRSE